MISTHQAPEYFEAASRLLGSPYSYAEGDRLVTQLDGDAPVRIAVFCDIVVGVRCELTVWCSPACANLGARGFLRAVFGVAFDQWRVRRVTAMVRPDNERSIGSVRRLGFEPEAVLERWFGDQDGICFRMFPEQCRWIQGVQS